MRSVGLVAVGLVGTIVLVLGIGMGEQYLADRITPAAQLLLFGVGNLLLAVGAVVVLIRLVRKRRAREAGESGSGGAA